MVLVAILGGLHVDTVALVKNAVYLLLGSFQRSVDGKAVEGPGNEIGGRSLDAVDAGMMVVPEAFGLGWPSQRTLKPSLPEMALPPPPSSGSKILTPLTAMAITSTWGTGVGVGLGRLRKGDLLGKLGQLVRVLGVRADDMVGNVVEVDVGSAVVVFDPGEAIVEAVVASGIEASPFGWVKAHMADGGEHLPGHNAANAGSGCSRAEGSQRQGERLETDHGESCRL